MTAEYFSGLLMGLLVGVAAGAVLEYKNYRRIILDKAGTGIRLEVAGRLFTIHEETIE